MWCGCVVVWTRCKNSDIDSGVGVRHIEKHRPSWIAPSHSVAYRGRKPLYLRVGHLCLFEWDHWSLWSDWIWWTERNNDSSYHVVMTAKCITKWLCIRHRGKHYTGLHDHHIHALIGLLAMLLCCWAFKELQIIALLQYSKTRHAKQQHLLTVFWNPMLCPIFLRLL